MRPFNRPPPFKRCYGMTFNAYQRARRMGLALHEIREENPW